MRNRRWPGLAVVGIVAFVALGATSCARRPAEAEARRPLIGIVDAGVDASVLPDVAADPASASLVPGEDLDDVGGHGTEMAWIVRRGAPGARIAAVKVIDRHGSASDEQIAAAIDHLRRSGASVILLSLAGAEPLPRTRAAIDAASRTSLVVAAAGNEGLDLRRARSYPGGYSVANLVTVAAVDDSGRLLGTSNRHAPRTVDATGSVPTCSIGGRPVVSTGTSAAAAVVAATAARDHIGADPVALAELLGGSAPVGGHAREPAGSVRPCPRT